MQSLIVREVQRLFPASDTVVYYPTATSAKHRLYFDKLQGDKIFLRIDEDCRSSTLAELKTFASIPFVVRRRHYDSYLVASFDSLIFSLLKGPRPGQIETFDDGLMSLSQSEIDMRIDRPDAVHTVIKRLFRAPSNRAIIENSIRHFTIYPFEWLKVGSQNPVAISLFSEAPRAVPPKSPLKIFLGSPVHIFSGSVPPMTSRLYRSLIDTPWYDLYLPHPGEHEIVRCHSAVLDVPEITHLSNSLIAEDLIGELLGRGLQLEIYGIASSALINVSKSARSFNLAERTDDAAIDFFQQFGIPSLDPQQLLAASSSSQEVECYR